MISISIMWLFYLCSKFNESHSLYNITSFVTHIFNKKILPIGQKSTVILLTKTKKKVHYAEFIPAINMILFINET